MKKIICGFVLFLLFGAVTFAQDGLSSISHLVSADTLAERGTVSRYDLAHFLNIADCTACLTPDTQLLETYSDERRAGVSADASTYIDDIVPGEETYEGQEYSICLATVIDNSWMSGYPRTTSPLCPGRFCGSNTLSFGEFVQTLSLFLGKKSNTYTTKTINRSDFSQRTKETRLILDARSQAVVGAGLDRCEESSCGLESQDEFDLYIRYCRHNLAACGMQETGGLSQGDYGVAFANILLDEGLLNVSDIQDLGRYTPLPSGLFLDVFDTLIQESGCNRSNDADTDGVQNPFDNCVNEYNPSQADKDKDTIGNVCDFDIDGDGILNAPGVIDDAGNVRYDLVKDSKDNCVFDPNTDQSDRDNDDIGDVCDTDEKSLAGSNAGSLLPEERLTTGSLKIDASVTQGNKPLLVDFDAVSDRVIQEIQRYFGDGDRSKKAVPEHIFTDTGVRTVRAVATFEDGSKAVAKQAINVKGDAGSFVAFQGYANVLQGSVPLEVTLQHIYQGELDTVVWTIGEEQKPVQAGQDLSYRFEGEGLYEVLAQGYRYSALVAVSRFNIDVLKTSDDQAVIASTDGRGAYLQADPLVVTVGDTATINTVVDGFSLDDVSGIAREIGDTTFAGDGFSTTQRFLDEGPVVVRQIIAFKDEYPSLTQEMTIYVIPNQEDANDIVGASLALSKDLLQVGEEVEAEIFLQGGTEDDIKSIQRNAGGISRENTSLVETFIFSKSGAQRVSAQIITNDGELLILESTLNVLGNEPCLTNQGVCDLDEDGIIDMCDSDIDGDGKENMLGIVIGENEACTFTKSVVDIQRLEQQIDRILKGADLDNCLFMSNEGQEDVDKDAYGDICDDADNTGEEPVKDTDKDGIIDEEDACPELPENKNGKEDEDGCPEFSGGGGGGGASAGSASAGGPGKDPYVKADSCVQCPCPKADYASELMPGDRVKAVLVDPSGEIIYSHSGPRAIRVNE